MSSDDLERKMRGGWYGTHILSREKPTSKRRIRNNLDAKIAGRPEQIDLGVLDVESEG
jgi:hypothetical protein